MGYVGLSLAVLLARHNNVIGFDTDEKRIAAIEGGTAPFVDPLIDTFLAQCLGTSFTVTSNPAEAYSNADFIVLAVPTDYDPNHGHFDTTHVEQALTTAREINPQSWIVIKSTVPLGYTNTISERTGDNRILFSPEFLREGQAVNDMLYPARVVVGHTLGSNQEEVAIQFAELLRECAADDAREDIPVLICTTQEAEAIKLFANTYLALRISFFNELDTFAEVCNLDTGRIIEGVCLDPRIGNYYNNPSFGYGGYCLPKDSKQLLRDYLEIPQNLISSVIEANRTRKDFITMRILDKARKGAAASSDTSHPTIGIYKLAMKKGSDNYRHSSILGIMRRLALAGTNVIVYDPAISPEELLGFELVSDFEDFATRSTLIVANRWHPDLEPFADKVYTRDLFNTD